MNNVQNLKEEEKVEKILQYMRDNKEYSPYKAVKKLDFGEYKRFKVELKKNKKANSAFTNGVQEVQNELCASTGFYAHRRGANDAKTI